jgi:hypothetical protein
VADAQGDSKMNNAFAGLKSRRTNYDTLKTQFETKPSGQSKADDRFYYPVRDNEGNGFALLRFLPSADDSPPFTEYFSHSFQGPGGWYWDDCRTSLGEDCPVCQANREVVNTNGGDYKRLAPDIKNMVSSRSRKLQFVSNVYVVKDTATPDNEGKVMLFRYGIKIMDKIKQVISPEFPGDPQFDPFNPWQGANFALKIRKVKGQTNYDASSFNSESPLFETDEEIIALAEKLTPLDEFTDPAKYTPYVDQLAKVNRVLTVSTAAAVGGFRADPVAAPVEPVSAEPTADTASNWEAPKVVVTDSSDDDMDEMFPDIDF